MDLDSVADELYGLPPGEFTGARNDRAKQARADGDRELAEQIRQLDKPTTSAWLVNQLARELADELEPLIALGREMREATSNISGAELRELTRQRHQVVNALVQQARRLGADHGTRVSDSVAGEVQQTLDASLSDPEAAEAVLGGRLTHALEYAGFGEPMGGGRSGPSRPRTGTPGRRPAKQPSTSAGKVADLAARRRESAERDLAAAEESLQAAQRDHETARRDGEKSADEVEAADRRVEELREELHAAEQQAREAGRAERSARQRLKHAEQMLHRAEQRHQDAADRLAELRD